MKISLKLLENSNKVTELVLAEIKKNIDNAINKSITNISSEIKELIAESLRSQPEYTSLMAGKLKAEFGISSAGSIPAIIDALIETLSVKMQTTTIGARGLSGGFTVTMMKSDDMNGVIYNDLAIVSSEEKGYILPWLSWLLYSGNEIIVKNYEVIYGTFAYSRSGMAIMKPADSSWKVPSEFSGTEEDNWTTRAINNVEDNIYKIIQKNIEQFL